MTMPGHEDMAGVSRRSVLRTAAGAGLAATAVAAAGAPALAATRHAPAAPDTQHDTSHDATDVAEPIVAHLRDARTGEIDLFRGTSQVRLHDQALAAQLIRASR
jgi:predicted nicotinamide N-methyase